MTGKQKRGASGFRPHPDADRIARALERCLPLAVPWQGHVYRATSHEYANRRDVVTGEGSRKAGARYTPRGAFRAIYGSLLPETALYETLAARRDRGLPDAQAMPLTFVALRLDLERVLDVTEGTVRQVLGISRSRLLAAWRSDQARGREALTQALGRLARTAGFQGILYESARRVGGRNLVIFPDHLRPGQVELVHAERLPSRRRRK
jgi:RES domain-containing protein